MDFATILPYITAASIALNGLYTWASYRRKEITVLVTKTMEFYRDDSKTVEELWVVMDDLDAVMTKK